MATANATRLPDVDIPPYAAAVLEQDADLPVCVTCGTQFPEERDDCPICEDPRQWVPEEGTSFTTLRELTKKHAQSILRDKDDPRIAFIVTEPTFNIGQTPILIETKGGSYIWDCCSVLTPQLVGFLLNLETPLVGIAISHPHFYTTSLTWSRALRVPLFLNNADQEWFSRLDELTPSDKVVWWREQKVMGPGVKLIECGGHFPGSSILHWNRRAESREGTPGWGVILTADTIAIQANRRGFTFMWSYPNMIPLQPAAVKRIEGVLADLDFDAASSAWPGRVIHKDAKSKFDKSVYDYFHQTGWKVRDGVLTPVSPKSEEEKH